MHKKETLDLLSQLKATHTPEVIQQRLSSGPVHSYLKDLIYGAIDGIVTTFAVVSGAAGAQLSVGVVIVMGLANLIGDGFSMAVSNYLGTRTEQQLRERARRVEDLHVQIFPEGEREEIRQIFLAKGFKGAELDRAVEIITSDRKQWIDMMVREELGMTTEGASPWKAAVSTFIAFVICGFLPLLAFLNHWIFSKVLFNPFSVSTVMTAITFFVVGALKSRYVAQRWYMSGFETFIMGGCAAGLAYVVGILLRGLASS